MLRIKAVLALWRIAAIVAVGAGQAQVTASLGMTRWQALRYVQLPQAVRTMMLSFVNQ